MRINLKILRKVRKHLRGRTTMRRCHLETLLDRVAPLVTDIPCAISTHWYSPPYTGITFIETMNSQSLGHVVRVLCVCATFCIYPHLQRSEVISINYKLIP